MSNEDNGTGDLFEDEVEEAPESEHEAGPLAPVADLAPPPVSKPVVSVRYTGFSPVVHEKVHGAIKTGAVITGTPDVIESLLKCSGFVPAD